MLAPTKLSLSPLHKLDPCEYQQAYKSEEDDGRIRLYHVCTLSENGTENCKYAARICRVKEEDEFYSDYIQVAVDNVLDRITRDNLSEGNWREL